MNVEGMGSVHVVGLHRERPASRTHQLYGHRRGLLRLNAPMESFWGSMQSELLNRQKWRTKLELALAMADYIEHFYNCDRRHSSLG
jgi:transposase InsO family protein